MRPEAVSLRGMTAPASRDPAVRADLLAAVEASADGLLAACTELLAIPSVGGTPGEVAAQAWLADRWRAEGLEVDHWPIDVAATTAEPEFPGAEVERTEAWGLVARSPGTGGGPVLLFDGHSDVVPPGDGAAWTGDPFAPRREVRDGRDSLVARGACDMKCGLVAAWFAVRALRTVGIRLCGDVLLASVVGEEDGGLGTYAMLRRGVRADLCVLPEPTSLDVIPANGGALTFRLRVPGSAIHAARRAEGVSAVEKFVPVLAALQDLEARRNAEVDPVMSRWPVAYPLSVGTVHAGDWASTVPDLLVAEGRLGVALGESVAQARAALEEAVARACAADPWLAEHPVEVEWWGGQFASGRTAAGHPLIDAVRSAHAEASGGASEAQVYGAPYGSDLRLLTGLGGIPTVQYGPGDTAVAHAADEYVAVDDVLVATRALALLALDSCA